MTNMSYVIFTALVMLLWITNLSVSYDITCTGYTALWSDTIPCWNVWFQVGITSHDILFQHPPQVGMLTFSVIARMNIYAEVWLKDTIVLSEDCL